ncbi:porin [Neisseria animaloris]|uniref:porin n=1 Tax=Neisseria animaloris TaxID=326522 RepID=UPI0039DF823A
MKKSILILAAALPVFALADVELYGSIRSGVSVSQVKTDTQRYTRTSVDDFGSYIGFKGSHPIGGGNNVIWQFEQDTPVGKSGSLREYFREKKKNSVLRTRN